MPSAKSPARRGLIRIRSCKLSLEFCLPDIYSGDLCCSYWHPAIRARHMGPLYYFWHCSGERLCGDR